MKMTEHTRHLVVSESRLLKSSLGHEDPLESAERHQNGGKHQLASVVSVRQLTFSAATKGEDSESWKCAIENESQRPG